MVPFLYNRRSLFVRKVTTLASLLGIALVVFVYAAVRMLSHGIETTLVDTGNPDNAILMRVGANAELQSGLTRNIAQLISVAPDIASDAKGALQAAELIVLVVLDRADGSGGTNITIRGAGPRSLDVHSQVKLREGRMFEHGQRQVVIGRKLAGRFRGASMGQTIKLGARETWTVVGVIEAGGSSFESEIWGDAEELMTAFQRPIYNSITARLKPGSFEAFKARSEADQRLKVNVKNEVQYYRDQSRFLAGFVSILGMFVAVVFSLGAAIGAMITMYAQVSARIREIGTLRAIGFSPGAILLGFLAESLFLSLLGGAIGIALSSLMELASFSTVNFATFSEVVFRFHLSGGIVIGAFIFSAFIGIFGGLAPAIRASRMKVVDAVRA